MRRAASATPVRSPALAMNRDHAVRDTPLSATRFARSASAQGSRWATEDRLAIRRNPSFPIQQTAPKPYLAACAEITPRGRNWNAEFQLAWEMEDHTIEQAEQRMHALRQIAREFEKEAATTVVQIVRLEKDMPHELPKFVQCFQVKNIFFRVLPDSRSGRNYIASLRGILQSGSALLSVPLSVMFYYRGMPVLAQALVPMTTQAKRLYGANSTNDAEVEAEMAFMAEALHIALPDSSMEVYEALDGRYYVTNSNATLTPLFLDDTIMKRQEMLRTCPKVIDGADNTMAVLDDPVLQDAVMLVCSSSPPSVGTSDTLRQLCDVLHTRGVNLCLLKQVARRVLSAGHYNPQAVRDAVHLIACEMVSRTLKQEFYIEVQGKRIAYDEVSSARALSKYFALVFASAPLFRAQFLGTISKKYGVTSDEDGDIIEVLVGFRAEWRSRIMDRVCHLLGATIRKESGDVQMTWKPFVNSTVVPQLVDPRVAILLVEAYTKVQTDAPHWNAFCLPLCWKIACWQQRFPLALRLAREDAAAQKERAGPLQLIRWFMERCVCHVCFKTRDWLCIQEGRSRFPQVLGGYEAWASAKTQGRRCTEYGFWLVDVAEGLVESPAELRSCVEEAVFYFQTAIDRMPKYLRSEHGAWLHLQPYIGLLRCKKLLHSCSVDTQSLVKHSVELSNIGWASDFFINYLWDLGRELEYEGDFPGAIQALRTAIALSKEKPTFAAELHTLLMDTAHVYRSWDLRLYAKECIELTNEAIAYAAQYYGTASRQYGVVVTNRGAIEIELGWLDQAEETLRRAGAALDAAQVPHDDPDYVAYLRNLDVLYRLRHPNLTAPTPLTGFLLRYPFLATGCEGVPWDDVRPLQDGAFVQLARYRAQEAAGTDEAFRLEAAMKRRVGELFRTLLAGATLKRFPFLPPQVDGVYVESLFLGHDRLFRELSAPWLRMAAESDERRLQERLMLAYVSIKARRMAHRRHYEHTVEGGFISAFGAAVNLMLPVDFVEVVEDVQVQQLMGEYDRKAAHRASGAELRRVMERLGERVDAWEREQWDWRQSISAWTPAVLLHSFFLADLTNDGPLRDLLLARQHRDRATEEVMPPRVLDARVEARCAAIWERGQLERLYSRSESQQLQQRYQLRSPRLHHQHLSAVFEDVLETWNASVYITVDVESRDHVVAAVQRRGQENRDVEYMEQWYPQLRAMRCPADIQAGLPHQLDTFYNGLQLRWHQGNCSDDVLYARVQQHLELRHSRARKARVGIMRDRLRTEAKYPFLHTRYDGIHLHDLHLEEDAAFCEYYEEYTHLAAKPKLAVRRMQSSETRMDARAQKLASQLRSREAALRQRFGGFLRRGDAAPLWTSVGLESVPRILQCEQYYAAHAEQQPPTAKAARDAARCAQEIRSYIRHLASDDAALRMLRNASNEEVAERYPYLSLRPLPAVPLCALPFECCGDFRRQTAALYALACDAAPGREQGSTRNPTPDSWVSLPDSASSHHSESFADKAQQLVHIVDEMAEEELAEQHRLQELYRGIPMEVLGIPSTQLNLPDNFAELWSQSSREGFHGPTAPLAYGALHQAAISVRALMLANLYADEHRLLAQPFLLYHTRLCISLRNLPLQEDSRYTALQGEYETLLQQRGLNSTDASLQRVRLANRADRVALRTSRSWNRLLSQLPRSISVESNQLEYLRTHTDLGRTPRSGSERKKRKPAGAEALTADVETSARRDADDAAADSSLRADLPFIAPHITVTSVNGDEEFVRLQNVLKKMRSTPTADSSQLTAAEDALRDYTSLYEEPERQTSVRDSATQQTLPATPTEFPTTVRHATAQQQPAQPFARQQRAATTSSTHTPPATPKSKGRQNKERDAPHASPSTTPLLTERSLERQPPTMQAARSMGTPLTPPSQREQLSSRYPFLRLHEEDGWPEALVA
ncbi:hypothetical protein ABB37_06817, partial [Leptomonas pyrrhocoris]